MLFRLIGRDLHTDYEVCGVTGSGKRTTTVTGLIERRRVCLLVWNVISLARLQPDLKVISIWASGQRHECPPTTGIGSVRTLGLDSAKSLVFLSHLAPSTYSPLMYTPWANRHWLTCWHTNPITAHSTQDATLTIIRILVVLFVFKHLKVKSKQIDRNAIFSSIVLLGTWKHGVTNHIVLQLCKVAVLVARYSRVN